MSSSDSDELLSHCSDESNEEYYYSENDDELDIKFIEPKPSFGFLERQVSYIIYGKEGEVEQSRSEILENESDLLGITKYEVNLILQHYNWDVQKMRDNFFSDENKVRQLCGIPITSNPDKDNILHSVIDKCNLCHRSCHPFFSSPNSPKADAESALKLTRSLSASDRDIREEKTPLLINNMNTFAIRSVNQQLKEIRKKGIYDFSLPEEDSFQRINIDINAGGMWDGLRTEFQILIPSNYPLSPPTVKCLKIKETFHPNVDPKDGSVCMHIITSDQWREVNTLTDVCMAMQDLFIHPNFDHSLNHLALELFEKDKDLFQKKIKSAISNTSSNTTKRRISSTLASSSLSMSIPLPTEEDYVPETFALECGHFFCDECWHRSLKNSIDNGIGCQFKNCLERNCNIIIPERLVKQIIPEKLDTYLKFQTTSYVASKQSTKNCPNPNCIVVIDYPKNNLIRDINCPCGKIWCWGCQGKPHQPINCSMVENFSNERTKLDCENVNFEAIDVKNCPNCKKKTFKDGGCYHMTCSRREGGCGHEYCWLCKDSWSNHSGTSFKCNKYESGNIEDEECLQAFNASKIVESHKKHIKRFAWHFERQKFLNRSCDAAREKGGPTGIINAEVEFLTQYIQRDIAFISEDEKKKFFDILPSANNAVIKCREALSWIYVAKYYFPAKGTALEQLFQSNQDDLETYTESLHEKVDKSPNSWIELCDTKTPAEMYEILLEVKKKSEKTLHFLEKITSAQEFSEVFGF